MRGSTDGSHRRTAAVTDTPAVWVRDRSSTEELTPDPSKQFVLVDVQHPYLGYSLPKDPLVRGVVLLLGSFD